MNNQKNITLSKVRDIVEVFRKAIELSKKIKYSCEKEVNSIIKGLNGTYIEPGPSGNLLRGKVEVLPTGRNFYAFDPKCLPTKSAWDVGVETANKLIDYYLKKNGKYPESIGFTLWSIDAYKADGEQLAQILYILGVRPVWDLDGSIKGLEVIPIDELGRPRIDVVVRISGIVRDTLPNYIYLIDEAIEKVVNLDEPIELNYVKKHYLEFIDKLVSLGLSFEDAKCKAMFRIFSSPPGSYGAGINYAIEASAWRNNEDLTKIWIQWSGYAYSRKTFGEKAYEILILNLEKVDLISRNHPSDEHDVTNCCSYYAYHGGFYNAAKTISKKNIMLVQVDTRDINNTKIVDQKVEIERIVRTKILNPIWIKEMKKHGYRGANEFSRKILHLYGWAASTRLVSDWIFNEIAKTYILSEEMRKWFMENNIYALEEITRRLIEAAKRNIWKPDKELLEKLKEIYAEIEGVLEEEVSSDVQGGNIEVITYEDDEHWRKSIKDIDNILRKIFR